MIAAPGGLAALTLLSDGRLPAGGHAHSGGIEHAVGTGAVTDAASLDAYIEGRLGTTGVVDAAAAVLTRCLAVTGGARPTVVAALRDVDEEVSARTASPVQRAAARAQGRGLLRVARRCWSSPALDILASLDDSSEGGRPAPARTGGRRGIGGPGGPFAVMALGAAAAAGGVDAVGTATAALWSAISGPAWAAVRLLGLDPLEVAAVLARRAPGLDRLAGQVAGDWSTDRCAYDLPVVGAPLVEIGAEIHRAWEVRLFAS